MAQEEKKTAVGKYIDRLFNNGELGSMSHSFDTSTMLMLGAIAIVSAVAIMALKKYVFKN